MIWRFVGFFLLTTALSYASEFVVAPLAHALHVDESSLNSGSLLLEEVVAAAGVILVTWIFAKIDRQRVDAYGLPVRLAFRGRFWEGAALGVVTAGAVAAGMYALGGFVIHGFARVRPAGTGARRRLLAGRRRDVANFRRPTFDEAG
jgi:hypothetical protein